MGKRKSRMSKLLAQPKKKPKLETAFTCPFCNHRESVECVIDPEYKYAQVECFVCKEHYTTKANPLTAPVDVYAEWIDACEVANRARHVDGGDVF